MTNALWSLLSKAYPVSYDDGQTVYASWELSDDGKNAYLFIAESLNPIGSIIAKHFAEWIIFGAAEHEDKT